MGIILSSIFAVALFSFFFSGVDSVRTHESQARAQAAGRTAIDRFAREARQAISPDDGLTAPIIALCPTAVEMYVDPSRSSASTTPRPYKVRYSVVAGALVRDSAAPVGVTAPFSYGAYSGREVLVEGIANGAAAVFSASTARGVAMAPCPATTSLRDIAQVSVSLAVAQKTGNANTKLELNTDVALRNAVRI
jgi:Tfp pilus assembly protein PilW